MLRKREFCLLLTDSEGKGSELLLMIKSCALTVERDVTAVEFCISMRFAKSNVGKEELARDINASRSNQCE